MIARSHKTPPERLRDLNGEPVRADGSYVLYWMTAARRAHWNYGLDRAVELAEELRKPLVVLEALRCDYGWASDRHHAFVLQGMRDNALACEHAGVHYHPYVEDERGAGKGLLRALARHACAVVTDDSPAFFLPRMLAAAASQVPVRFEAADSCGLLPLRATDKLFLRAFDLRRYLLRELGPHLARLPRRDALEASTLPTLKRLPSGLTKRWPRADKRLLSGEASRLQRLPIDHGVAPSAHLGGAREGRRRLERFLTERLSRYEDDGRHPDREGTSGLSPYLHYGHVSAYQILDALREATPVAPPPSRDPRASAWAESFGLGEPAAAFLDQVVTWRELSYQFAAKRADHQSYDSLPDWARKTLREHAGDRRPHSYGLEQFERAETHNPLWNAAQTQLRTEGVMHNYLRMLWGKKILHWSRSPREALKIMVELNNKYALDGRDPNSYGGIFWILGRHDRAWGPEREVFGKIRYMSSANTLRKLRVKEYLGYWSQQEVR